MIQMGIRARDKLTGFVGIVTARAQYITGCDQYLLQPPVKEDGEYANALWFDEARLELLPASPVEPESVQNKRNGGPQSCPAPVK